GGGRDRRRARLRTGHPSCGPTDAAGQATPATPFGEPGPVIRRVNLLVTGTLLVWLVLAVGAMLLSGSETVLLTAAAMGICLVPALGTLVLTEAVGIGHPEFVGIIML